MAKDNNLSDFLLDLANTIRTKTGESGPINPQDFSQKIQDIPTGSAKTELEITTNLMMERGDQTIAPEDSATQTMSKVIVKKPETLISSNIRSGVEIGGVVGDFTGEGLTEKSKTEPLNMSEGNQIINPDAGTTMSQVTIIKPETFIPGNIKKGVNIGGVEGTLEMGGIDISDTTAISDDVRKGKVFYLSDGTKTQGTIENYGGASLSTLATTLSQKQYGMSAIAIGDKIYLHGQNKNFELFDTKTNTHSLLDAVTNRVTYYVPIAAVDNKIYLCGGDSSKNIVVFNPETNEVETKEVSYSFETGCSGASVGNKIYLFGSSTLSQGTIIYIYDIINNTLSKSNVVLPISAGEIAACAINDKIYLFGGHNRDTSTAIYGTFLDSINVFDTTNNTISTLNVTLPVKMSNIGAAALGNKIYLFGGLSEAYKHNTIYEFDTSTNTISKLNTVLPDGFLGIAAAAANNKIYLFGGQSNSGLQSIIQEFDPKTSILITSKSGEVLETSGKYCVDNIYVYPKLETKHITTNGLFTPSDGYAGVYDIEVNVPAGATQERTVTITENGTQEIVPEDGYVLSKVTAIVNVPTSGGAELNIHYGDTAPEDTSKLWVKTTKPDSVEISPDFGYGEAIQTTGVKSGFPTGTVCVDGDYLYAVSENYIKKYDKNTFTFISDLVYVYNKNVYSILVHNGILYYMESVYTQSGFNSYIRAKLHAYDLTTKEETVLKSDYKRAGARLQLYNDKLYIIGGGYNDNDSYIDVSGCDIYDISKNTWETAMQYSIGGSYYGCVIIGNNTFIFGGRTFDGDTKYTAIRRANLDTKTVTKCNAVLPIATYAMGVSHLGNYVYLSGGSETSKDVYRYNTETDTIEKLNVTLEHARATCATFFNGTELYLSGSNSIVDKLQIDVPLSSTKLKIISDWLNNQFAIVNSSSAKVMIGVNKAFKGDENNKAKEVTAYVHDGVNWHNLNGEITFTKLYAPKISISGKTLTITNDERNGAYATNYTIYNGDTALTTIRDTTLDLTTVITTNGTYNISAIALGIGYTDSDRSNVVEYNYAVYSITTNLTGVTANASNPTTVSTLASSTLTFTANTGYNLPDNVTVTGAEFTWTKSSGTLVLSNPMGNVSVTVAGVAISYTITPTLTNVTAASGNATTIATGETKTLTYTAADGYVLPDTITVTGATGIWNKDTGTLILSNPTANVTFTIAGVEAASGHAVTITAAAGSYGVKIYDGTSSSGTLLGTIADQDNTPKTVTCASSNLYLISDNGAYTDANTIVTGGVTIVSEGSYNYDGTFNVTADGTITISLACLIEGTQITLADGSTKAIEDITYDDELLVWNFYEGKFDIAKPTWIKVAEVAPRYNLVKFSNGAEVGFVGAGGENGYHRIFNKEAGAFTHTGCKDTPNGTTTFAQDKTFPTVVSQEVVEKEVKFYNVITDKHYNLFANGILTSCKLSNKYRIEDMRYIGERLISDEQEKAYFERI